MSFKRLEGHNVLFRAMAVSAEQMKLVGEIRALYAARECDEETAKRYAAGHFTRKELRDAHGELRGKKAAPYFISKNVACKIKGQHGMYSVNTLKERAGAVAPVKADATPMPKRKESKPKRESKKIAAAESKELATV